MCNVMNCASAPFLYSPQFNANYCTAVIVIVRAAIQMVERKYDGGGSGRRLTITKFYRLLFPSTKPNRKWIEKWTHELRDISGQRICNSLLFLMPTDTAGTAVGLEHSINRTKCEMWNISLWRIVWQSPLHWDYLGAAIDAIDAHI